MFELHRRCFSPSNNCPYQVDYLSNGTSSIGFLVEDVLHLITNDDETKPVEAKITFGFVTLKILWEGSDWILPNGLFGHGVDNTSVPSILAKEKLVSNSFTLCFGYDGVGRITFGNKGSSDQGETPLNLRQSHPTYNVSVTQIKVGGNAGDLEFNAIFDSGTSFTYLNDPAYTLISESWQPASKCLDRNCRPGKKTIEPPTKARNTNHAMAHVKPRAHTQTKATPLQCLPSDLNFQTFHGAFSCLSRFQFLLAFPLIKAPE
ncbi:hypothetical protein V6N11_022834 [Hibiscus sabdariffa]|uniref:Peptidase A1 domain-containing protein n=1 Tax=Hibiscus sabdariffa TaxID=183260 RepID=A0ABR2TKD1_9ROSI